LALLLSKGPYQVPDGWFMLAIVGSLVWGTTQTSSTNKEKIMHLLWGGRCLMVTRNNQQTVGGHGS